ncbi:Uma2 family endonuclease [Coleofasciculus sp. D1-CHI-01]|uniref:Uma2 family endonuclease n=1 Tax=Coleofasciculus sp. D1-CHI-01 TaxID=3068482 RepID=UPI0040635FDC
MRPDVLLFSTIMTTVLNLKPLQDKMQEYLASGLRLGWLINHQDRQVEIYRGGTGVDIVAMPVVLSGEEVLPGLSLEIL